MTESESTTTTDADASTADRNRTRSGRDVVEYVQWGTLVVLVGLSVVALLQFYSSASAAIATWVAPAYEPAFQAAFNLVVLLVCAAGISVLARELRD